MKTFYRLLAFISVVIGLWLLFMLVPEIFFNGLAGSKRTKDSSFIRQGLVGSALLILGWIFYRGGKN